MVKFTETRNLNLFLSYRSKQGQIEISHDICTVANLFNRFLLLRCNTKQRFAHALNHQVFSRDLSLFILKTYAEEQSSPDITNKS